MEAMRTKLRDYFRRTLMRLLDIPSLEEFDEKDQKQINDWLLQSVGHRGFHSYVKSRDRAFAQAMIGMPIEQEGQRRKYYEYQGARAENARLIQRATALQNQKTGIER